MKSIKSIFACLAMTMLPLSSVNITAKPVTVPLQVSYDDPVSEQDNENKGPILTPEVGIEGYTLYFNPFCLGYTLRLVDENDNVVYTTIINGDTLVLPSTLSGEYELQILFDDCYFYGWIEL